jgi:hypothetical protein
MSSRTGQSPRSTEYEHESIGLFLRADTLHLGNLLLAIVSVSRSADWRALRITESRGAVCPHVSTPFLSTSFHFPFVFEGLSRFCLQASRRVAKPPTTEQNLKDDHHDNHCSHTQNKKKCTLYKRSLDCSVGRPRPSSSG